MKSFAGRLRSGGDRTVQLQRLAIAISRAVGTPDPVSPHRCPSASVPVSVSSRISHPERDRTVTAEVAGTSLRFYSGSPSPESRASSSATTDSSSLRKIGEGAGMTVPGTIGSDRHGATVSPSR